MGLKKGETESLQCNLTRMAGPNITIKWYAENQNKANIGEYLLCFTVATAAVDTPLMNDNVVFLYV